MRELYYRSVAGHPGVTRALMGQASNTLRPFQRYLHQAVRTAQQRQVRYKLRWEPVREQQLVHLEPLDARYVVQRPAAGWLIENWPAGKSPDRDQLMMVVNRGETIAVDECEATLRGVRIRTAGSLQPDDKVFWCGVECALAAEDEPAEPRELQDGSGELFPVRAVQKLGTGAWLLVVSGRPDRGSLRVHDRFVDAEELPPTEGLRRVFDGQRQAWPVIGAQLEVEELPAGDTLQGDNGVRFRWRQSSVGRRSGRWIQLLPPDQADADELSDPRVAFCEDEVKELWTAPRKHEGSVIPVKRVDRDRFQLQVDTLPPPGSLLHLPLDVRNLRLQRRALRQLAEAPLPHHQGLLRLCEDPARVRWPALRPRWPDAWRMLADEHRSGTEQQREFVTRALGTPDIILLEGPPGSGKTTAICELILQLVERGERVLLCASTHVAIDNVLERLMAGDEPLDAVRIGRVERVDEKVQEAQLDRRVEQLVEAWRAVPGLSRHGGRELTAMAERTIIMAADLTCGTTMGIVNHPLFQGRDEGVHASERPIATSAHWDVLIVDEASKTTIQEFLVPALMARRWVIVGDVRQLPPFAERADIIANLRSLVDARGREVFLAEHQRAMLLLWRLRRPELAQPGPRWLVVEPARVLEHMEDELAATCQAGEDSPITAVRVVRRRERHAGEGAVQVSVAEIQSGHARALHLAAASWILVPEDVLADISAFLPADLLATRDLPHGPSGRALLAEDAAWHFRHAAWLSHAARLSEPVRSTDRRRGTCDTYAALEDSEAAWLAQKDWAGEVAWRITRIHELRRSRRQDERERCRREIRALQPRTAEVGAAIEEIRDIGLPSILEVVQEGIGEERSKRPSALTEGLAQRQRTAFDQRFVSLSFQHRMHPDISALPRKLFYSGDALRDASTIAERETVLGWGFASESPARALWLDVRGHETGGVNRHEVDRMRDMLEEFLGWARRAGPPRRDRPRRWEVACLSFYAKQEEAIRHMLKELTGDRRQTRFSAPHAEIVCGTVDRFQGREADLVLLSMRNTRRVGFLDSVNRLNVAVTRAREQLAIVGDQAYFARCPVVELRELAKQTPVVERERRGSPRPGAGRRKR